MTELREDPAYREICRERNRVCMARKRAENGREPRSKYGLPHGYLQQHGFANRQGPAVAELLSQGLTPEQIHQALLAREDAPKESPPIEVLLERIARRYFQSHEFVRKAQAREEYRRNMQDPEFVLYMRQKSKRRKAILRGSIGVQVKGKQIRARFAEFNHCCAYCGAGGDMQIEHVVPISRGGTHVLSNIVPACQDCNYSKTYKEVEPWYRAQPFFCERRWRKILKVIGIGKGSPNQLALL